MLAIQITIPLALAALCSTVFAHPRPDSTPSDSSLLSQYDLSSASAATATVPSVDGLTALLRSSGGAASNLTGPPAGFTVGMQYSDRFPLNRLEAEQFLIAMMVEQGQRSDSDIVPEQPYYIPRLPDVTMSIEPEPGHSINVKEFMWALQSMHAKIKTARGLNWVACGGALFQDRIQIGSIGLLPSRRSSLAQHGTQDTTASNGTFDSSSPVSTNAVIAKRLTVDDSGVSSRNGSASLGRGDVVADITYQSSTGLGELNLYLMYSNAVLAFFDLTAFGAYTSVDIRNEGLGIYFTFIPPPRPAQGQPRRTRISRGECMVVVGETAKYTAARHRFDEVLAIATIDRALVGTFAFSKLN